MKLLKYTMNFFAYFQVIYHSSVTFMRHHLWVHYFHLDFVHDCSSIDDTLEDASSDETFLRKMTTKFKRNIHYLLPFAGLVAIVLDSLLIIAAANFQYDSTAFPELFTHKIYMKSFWTFSDVIISVVLMLTMTVYALLLLGPSPEHKWTMFALHHDDGSVHIIVNGKGQN